MAAKVELYARPLEQHRRGCLCMRCVTVGHPPECRCWMCESRRHFFEQPERRVPDSSEAAKHLAELGLSFRQAAAASGLSLGVLSKASKPGRRIDRRTEERILGLQASRES